MTEQMLYASPGAPDPLGHMTSASLSSVIIAAASSWGQHNPGNQTDLQWPQVKGSMWDSGRKKQLLFFFVEIQNESEGLRWLLEGFIGIYF